MLFFADSGERAVVQALLMGTVVAVMVSTLLLVALPQPPFPSWTRRACARWPWSERCRSLTRNSTRQASRPILHVMPTASPCSAAPSAVKEAGPEVCRDHDERLATDSKRALPRCGEREEQGNTQTHHAGQASHEQ